VTLDAGAGPEALTALRLSVLPQLYSICRLPPDSGWPQLGQDAGLLSVTRTADELSVVCRSELAPAGATCQPGWRVVGVEGPLAFELIGIVAQLTAVLANALVSVFVISTFDTDYILVRAADLERAIGALRAAGHSVLDR
jgi:uncharacterized protein